MGGWCSGRLLFGLQDAENLGFVLALDRSDGVLGDTTEQHDIGDGQEHKCSHGEAEVDQDRRLIVHQLLDLELLTVVVELVGVRHVDEACQG
jgi:hypothetical protein